MLAMVTTQPCPMPVGMVTGHRGHCAYDLPIGCRARAYHVPFIRQADTMALCIVMQSFAYQ
jgi:hypothetical protein